MEGKEHGTSRLLEIIRQNEDEVARVKVAQVDIEKKYDGCLWEFMSIKAGDNDAMLQFGEKWGLTNDFRTSEILSGLVYNVFFSFAGFEDQDVRREEDFRRDPDLPVDDAARWARIMSETDHSRKHEWLVTESKIAGYKISSAFMFRIREMCSKWDEYTVLSWIFWFYVRSILLLAAKIRGAEFDTEAAEMGFLLYLFEEAFGP